MRESPASPSTPGSGFDRSADEGPSGKHLATDGGEPGPDPNGEPGADDVPAPSVPVGDGWRRVEATVDTAFDARVVTVRAHTIVYEDASMRTTIRDRTGVDALWRFVFASRLALRPQTPPSGPLTQLVRNRSEAGFVDQLRERGFTDVHRRDSRRFRVGDADTKLTGYDASLSVAGVELAVDGWVAVWPADPGPGYILAGGAYPTAVVGGATEGETAATLQNVVRPGGFREELLELIRGTS
jgi:hypothetical protein